MEGRAQAEERQIELAMFNAWQTGVIVRSEKIHAFKYYLDTLLPRKPLRKQTPEEMIAVLRAIKASKEVPN